MNSALVIAGPSCVGKSHFTKNIHQKEYSKVRDTLFLDDIPDKVIDATSYSKVRLSGERIVLHININRLKSDSYWKNDRINFFNDHEFIKIVTLRDAPDLLRRRVLKRARSVFFRNILLPREAIKKLRKLYLLYIMYRDNNRIESIYRKWYSFCESIECEHYEVNPLSISIDRLK